MPRKFNYAFKPANDDPVGGSSVVLTVQEIEDAALKEILQAGGSDGARLGTWGLLDALLEPTGPNTPFLFRRPLGNAREVKVALSGLFGRFVARAYLTRYFGLTLFGHISGKPLILAGGLNVEVKKKRRQRGDYPDWIAARPDLTQLTIAEAKGCHDTKGPAAALGRAWTQANRVNVFVGTLKSPVKRIAIATRWGAAHDGEPTTRMSVRDPVDEGDRLEPAQSDAIYVGLVRIHIANLLRPLGHGELADALTSLVASRSDDESAQASIRVRHTFDTAQVFEVSRPDILEGDADMIGGVVTRAGPLAEKLTDDERQTLIKLDLRPTFVGVPRRVVEAALKGDASLLRDTLTEVPAPDITPLASRAEFVVRLDQDQAAVSVRAT